MQRPSKHEWWRFACVFLKMPSSGQKELFSSRTIRAHLKRVAKLHPHLGDTLDARRAPFRVYVFIAYAPDRIDRPLVAGQQARFRSALAFYERNKRWPTVAELRELRLGIEAPPKVEAPSGPPAAKVLGDLAACFAIAAQAQDPELAELLKRFSEDRKKRSPPGVANSP